MCFDLGLVLHELVTNSSKYGAFAGEKGRVGLKWSITSDGDRKCFVLEWSDSVHQTGATTPGTGFGTRLIRQLVESKWSGRVTTELEPNFHCVLSLPLPEA